MDAIPIWALFTITIILVVIAIESGYRLGRTVYRLPGDEKDSPVSTIGAAVLGLLAFILAFTFSAVTNRYNAREALVQDEANAIRTAWLRADFLSETDRNESKVLLFKYVDLGVSAIQSGDQDRLKEAITEVKRIHSKLWDITVVNAGKNMNPEFTALYVESLNEVINIHSLRIAVGLQTRIPGSIWLVLYALIILGMMGIGYQTAITNSIRSWAMVILALSFSVVITLIALLDNPQRGYILVPQQPLIELRAEMEADMLVK